MKHRALLVAVAATVAACSPSPDVDVESADLIAGPLRPDGQAGLPDATDGPSDDDQAPTGAIAWGPCDDFGIPERTTQQTPNWECGRLTVDMDPFGVDASLGSVELALTRHRATGDRLGSLLINPGGPGAAGLPTAWGLRSAMPTELLRGFDIVSWDPRGVGRSMPVIDCGGADSFDVGYMATCVALTGELSAYLAAPYSAADMEAIRVALGEQRLDYLGFSYGSILGSEFARAHPDRVGAFVLDGVTDPLVGSTDGPFEGAFAVFADDGRDEAFDRLIELCDLTDRCLPGRSAAVVVDLLYLSVGDLATDDFDADPARVTVEDFQRLLDQSLGFAGDWELLATALDDADGGDASALASMIAGPDGDGPGGESVSNFADANFMIYCADLGRWSVDSTFCDGLPANERAVQPVSAVDIDVPMLVIGTEYDPLTPGKHAPDFAAAIGDASHLIWEGVGHTAFPGWTDCIDDAVAAQFVSNVRPPDGTRCSMIEDAVDDTELADDLFGYGESEAIDWLTDAIEVHERVDGDAACIASGMIVDGVVDDRIVSHMVLDVTSDASTVAATAAAARC